MADEDPNASEAERQKREAEAKAAADARAAEAKVAADARAAEAKAAADARAAEARAAAEEKPILPEPPEDLVADAAKQNAQAAYWDRLAKMLQERVGPSAAF